jgi:hypothetical protein
MIMADARWRSLVAQCSEPMRRWHFRTPHTPTISYRRVFTQLSASLPPFHLEMHTPLLVVESLP